MDIYCRKPVIVRFNKE